ncbi:hypothetical protein QE152_g28488 [Popillia japonica]|uniref:Reverse transcriptase n=1 Tax=Popillia japonica TaxID=7064 RepID=A0AAW1JJS9_POPJA
MQQLAKEEAELYPTGSSIVLRDFYVDDLLTGANTINEARTIINELTELLPKGGFALRKWSSNCKELLNPISDSSIDSVCLNLSKDNIKTLGLLWNAESDILQYQLIHQTVLTRSPKDQYYQRHLNYLIHSVYLVLSL